MTLPYGWSAEYAITHCLDQINTLSAALELQKRHIANLEKEVKRLEESKANRAGRKATARA